MSTEAAVLYMCNASNKECRNAIPPNVLRQLVLEDANIYKSGFLREQQLRALEIIHQGRIKTVRIKFRYNDVTNKHFLTEDDLESARALISKNLAGEIAIAVFCSFTSKPGKSHANAVLVNRKHQTFEHFEPHGVFKNYIYNVEDAVKEYIPKLGFPGFKYIAPKETCPNLSLVSSPLPMGPQSMLNRNRRGSPVSGTCVMWSLWYLHIRLVFPELDPQQAVQTAYDLIVGASGEGDGEGCTAESCAPESENNSNCSLFCSRLRLEESGQAGRSLEQFIVLFTEQLIKTLNLRILKKTTYDVLTEQGELVTSFTQDKLKKELPEVPAPDPNKLVVYGKKYCKFCSEAQYLVRVSGKSDQVEYIDLDDYSSASFFDTIYPLVPTKYTSVPFVFYKGTFAGGFDKFRNFFWALDFRDERFGGAQLIWCSRMTANKSSRATRAALLRALWTTATQKTQRVVHITVSSGAGGKDVLLELEYHPKAGVFVSNIQNIKDESVLPENGRIFFRSCRAVYQWSSDLSTWLADRHVRVRTRSNKESIRVTVFKLELDCDSGRIKFSQRFQGKRLTKKKPEGSKEDEERLPMSADDVLLPLLDVLNTSSLYQFSAEGDAGVTATLKAAGSAADLAQHNDGASSVWHYFTLNSEYLQSEDRKNFLFGTAITPQNYLSPPSVPNQYGFIWTKTHMFNLIAQHAGWEEPQTGAEPNADNLLPAEQLNGTKPSFERLKKTAAALGCMGMSKLTELVDTKLFPWMAEKDKNKKKKIKKKKKNPEQAFAAPL